MPCMSKLSFQYGFNVFLMTDVVRVCSPPIVATAKGSGKPIATDLDNIIEHDPLDIRKTSRLYKPSAAITMTSELWYGDTDP